MSGRGWPRVARVLTTGLLVIAGCAALVVALTYDEGSSSPADTRSAADPGSSRTRSGPSEAPPRTEPTPSTLPVNADRTRGPVLAESVPVGLRIARIGLVSDLVPLGIDREGAMEVPPDGSRAGWYTKAPSPGALGPAVLAAHVTWDRRPALFFRLQELRQGDRIEVARQDGITAVFRVRRVASFAKARFPTEAVYGPVDHAALRLITCGGAFDEDVGRYVDNVVVFAALVESRPTGS
jgi:Sortase domain